MSLSGDKGHLTQLAGELPQEQLAELRGLIAYAGEEAKIALGQGDPRFDDLSRGFIAVDKSLGEAQGALGQLETLLYELGT